ncbi:NAD(P)H-hydrate dehydratase [Phenylobacterium sp.]|uniref:NAD(P)H-hydrate dehydratase n=1 Tax=Phenylobacterium sp. TaxID=1871053 RepID=UPI0027361B15|nr:NAD(P)H-hydrate dehydratase [Phenylobacterium sp.]MDP3591538.1 NAD(P)H-hydrate dehydratase [Phenylobacterium sp.]
MTAGSEIGPELLRAIPLPSLSAESDKEERGRVLVVAGGAAVPGAATLTGLAALRVGAGKLQLAATEQCAIALGMAVPEARIISTPMTPEGEIAGSDDLLAATARSDVVILGPGMMEGPSLGDLVERLVSAANSATLVIDAAAMSVLRPEGGAVKAAAGRLVLTPHAGEMAALLDCSKAQVLEDLAGAARILSARLNAVVVIKTGETYVVSPDGRGWRHAHGAPGLGTSGSGDVLAGVIGGLAARGAPPAVAAVWGVWLHARAGARLSSSIGKLGFLARELLGQLPGALEDVGRV